MIEVLYEQDEEYTEVFEAFKSEPNWKVEDKKDEHYFLKLLGFDINNRKSSSHNRWETTKNF
ncbi:unnamed protein product [Meloidogyne enterolobii]|uniref:Uncharacterized protein n=1 Tax=Meloidogyne enterolobii TaxID=390850 RepID=A0ACB0Z3F5_MELEN